MNDSPLQLCHTVHEQKGRRVKKEDSKQMPSCSSGFPYDMNDQNYSSTQMALKLHSPCKVSPGALSETQVSSWCACR